MILVDSSVWVDHFRNADNGCVRHLRASNVNEILVGDLVLLEVLQGARDDNHATQLATRLQRFQVASLSSEKLAVASARNYRHLRSRGITIRKTIDLIIATFCITHDHELLHSDRDFAPFAQHLGLRLALPPA